MDANKDKIERFVREDRTLQEWIIDLTAKNLNTRQKAGEIIYAMSCGVSSVHTDLEEVIFDKQEQNDLPKQIKQIFSVKDFHSISIIKSLINYYKSPQYSNMDLLMLTASTELVIESAGVKEALPELLELIKTRSRYRQLQRTAAKAIETIGGEAVSAFDTLFAASCGRLENFARCIAKIISDDQQKINYLIEVLSTKSTEKIKVAVDVLSFLGNKAKPALPYLKTLVTHNDEQIRTLVIYAFGKLAIQDNEVDQILLNTINKNDGHVKSIAIEALAKTSENAEIVVPILKKALLDEDYGFCEYEGCVSSAQKLLCKFANYAQPALPELLEKLGDPDENQRDLLKLLAVMGKSAREALPKLQEILQNTDEEDVELLEKTIASISKD